MFDQFIINSKEKQLIKSGQKILLAISGGIDSMVLLHLFERSEFEYGIAHCNFRLRGDESDGDEAFVREQVEQHGTAAHFETFDTIEYASLKGISIEMAARELRYGFFERISKEYEYDCIVTAHHQDDLIETFFLNLSRKTGIKGLTGIKEKKGKLIRPLLFASREDIERYAAENSISYREDSSNNEVVFQRNFLRHKILPLFSELNPAFKKNFMASVDNLKVAYDVYKDAIGDEIKAVLTNDKEQSVISIPVLQNSQHPKTVLLEILSGYGFNASIVDAVYQSLETHSGKQFFSKTHRLVKDRDALFIQELTDDEDRVYYIEEDDMELFAPFDISIERLDAKGFSIIKEANTACVDLEKVQFPLLMRKWKQGDYFQPLGMTGFKKVSDFFIDRKMPLHEKENTWLLCSGKNIVWIMGQRLDNRFKVTPSTKQVLKIEIG
ncbi:tRNA(Ile)-lysidine synthase [Draconibacterium orientale]|uniref:tRNA(Ile)-lysidine synthase n=1 Tax=Draconibacterium orientale TaxID=1168034 RepID=X5DHF3_9BACT|nr:tRNA lysidine(34) synthetase TilS [Draconibacterium orientale]AHW60529.1 cell-cycle protein [Draconibacterium orientale]SET44986.1 tRNA(Ile)-lysidine synthase [Draconibacterium orientale]